MVNDNWITSFLHNVASFLAPSISSHSPCLVKLVCPLSSAPSKPFKFFNYLIKHNLFLALVKAAKIQCRNTISNLTAYCVKLKALERSPKTLDKESFSDIQKRVKETNSLLQAIQVQALENPSIATFQLERPL